MLQIKHNNNKIDVTLDNKEVTFMNTNKDISRDK